jgi:hypothetical protein
MSDTRAAVTERDEWVAHLRGNSIPYAEAQVTDRDALVIQVPDAGIGRTTPEHPGVTIAFLFVAGGRFAGIVRVKPPG